MIKTTIVKTHTRANNDNTKRQYQPPIPKNKHPCNTPDAKTFTPEFAGILDPLHSYVSATLIKVI